MVNFIPTEIPAKLLKPGDILRYQFILADIPSAVSPARWGFVVEKVTEHEHNPGKVVVRATQIDGDIHFESTVLKELRVIIGKF